MPSALGQAVQLGLEIESLCRQVAGLNEVLSQYRRGQQAWRVGAAGEAAVVDVLVGMDDARWHVLPDRHWPGTRRANIDVLFVGPGGVFVIDVKNWRDAHVDGHGLWHGDELANDAVDKILDQTRAVEDVLVDAGLAPTEVVPLLALAGRRNTRAQVQRLTLLGEFDLVPYFVRLGVRLTPPMVEQVLDALETGCPPVVAEGLRPSRPAPARHRRTDQEDHDEPESLIDREQLWQALIDAAARETIESWMTWLHPAQARLVNRAYSGPARIRGGAGTGKTVVALHRAKYLAASGKRVLFTSFVKTLSPVNRALFARIAPDLKKHVEFASVHALARRFVQSQEGSFRYDDNAAQTCWARAWGTVGRHASLPGLGVPPSYWRDEALFFIKGRGIDDLDDYLSRPRTGRRTPLQPMQRRDLWRTYERYQELLFDNGILDSSDVLRRARDLARQDTSSSPQFSFDAVIVDEAQDLTYVALQFLHALVGDEPNGLLIVGDGQQAIYAGGGTLAEASISVVGRSTVLRHNYRNRQAILDTALAVVEGDEFADLDSEPYPGARDIEAARPGGELTEVVGDPRSQGLAMCRYLQELMDAGSARLGDVAVLVASNQAVCEQLRLLRTAGIPACDLNDYDGHHDEKVKVGTYHRAKGLEFAYVCLPDRDQHPHPRRSTETDEAYRERAETERRQIFVAMTRAREGLWIGTRTAMIDTKRLSLEALDS